MTTKRIKTLFGLASVVFGLVGAVRDLKSAREDGDLLALVNAVASLVAAGTGGAIAIREIRSGDDSE
jgi:hypothetical protein